MSTEGIGVWLKEAQRTPKKGRHCPVLALGKRRAHHPAELNPESPGAPPLPEGPPPLQTLCWVLATLPPNSTPSSPTLCPPATGRVQAVLPSAARGGLMSYLAYPMVLCPFVFQSQFPSFTLERSGPLLTLKSFFLLPTPQPATDLHQYYGLFSL